MKKVTLFLVVFLLIIGIFYTFTFFQKKEKQNQDVQKNVFENKTEIVRGENEVRIPKRYACVGEYCDGSMDDDNPASRTVLQIPLVKDGGTVGCGAAIFYAPHAIPKIAGVLDATYKLLFDIRAEPEIKEDGFRNTIALYQKLFYDGVTISNGVAKVMLSGSMYGPGHCADPEVRAQINNAAFYFDSVKTVEVYLNGKRFDWCALSDADPTEDGCDKAPKYWIDNK